MTSALDTIDLEWNHPIQPVVHILIYDILLYYYVLYIIEMKSFFNHWRLSISPGSVGKINSHQQRGSGWLWRAHCGGSVEGNHFLDQQIQKLKESLGLFTYIWMVNFYANSIHEYIYIHVWEHAGNFFPGWGWYFRWWLKKVLFVEFFMFPNLTCADVSNGWKQR